MPSSSLKESQGPGGASKSQLGLLSWDHLMCYFEPLPHVCSRPLCADPALLWLPQDSVFHCDCWRNSKAGGQTHKPHDWLRTRYWTHLASTPHLELGLMGVSAWGCCWNIQAFDTVSVSAQQMPILINSWKRAIARDYAQYYIKVAVWIWLLTIKFMIPLNLKHMLDVCGYPHAYMYISVWAPALATCLRTHPPSSGNIAVPTLLQSACCAH